MVTVEDVETARKLVKEKPSASYLQRKMLISYSDAMTLLEILEEEGVISVRDALARRSSRALP